MDIGITTLQRDRNPYIIEWVAFHLAVGFTRLYVYSHRSVDGMNETLNKIAAHYPVIVHEVDDEFPQAPAYVHSVNHHLSEVDWMAFIDGDEFLFPVKDASMQVALNGFENEPLSALGVYWTCYGTSGHLEDPTGLMLEAYTRHSAPDFYPNRFFKSIVRGRGAAQVSAVSAHSFATALGTFDEKLRLLQGHELADSQGDPSSDIFRINHYMTQSYAFYEHKKSKMIPPDGNMNSNRTLEAFDALDRNECDDGIRYRFLVKLKLKVKEIKAKIGAVD